MSTIAARRAQFASTAAVTATPQALLVMLYDRLVLDLQKAERAHASRDLAATSEALLHAQDIVLALADALDTDVWKAGSSLKALYAFLLTELATANSSKDVTQIQTCRALVEPLRDAWREVATGLAGAPGAAVGGVA